MILHMLMTRMGRGGVGEGDRRGKENQRGEKRKQRAVVCGRGITGRIRSEIIPNLFNKIANFQTK